MAWHSYTKRFVMAEVLFTMRCVMAEGLKSPEHGLGIHAGKNLNYP